MKILLASHVAAGILALLIGLVAMSAKKYSKLHRGSGQVYFWLVSFVCLTGVILPFFNWSKNWWLLLVSLFSYFFAFKGWRAEKKREEGWIKEHIRGMLGSYIAMVTAFVVVNIHRFEFLNGTPKIVFWVAPTVIAVPMIRMTVNKWTNSK